MNTHTHTHTVFRLGTRQCFVLCRALRVEVTRAMCIETRILFEHVLLGYPVNRLRGCDDGAPDMLMCHYCLQCFRYSVVALGPLISLKAITFFIIFLPIVFFDFISVHI